MRVLDLFSGIGGFSLGLERAGFETVGFCEVNPFCRSVLAKHWPDIPCHDDITTRQFTPGEADVICGGFPCQDISKAGRGAGLAGNRSGLWREMVRAVRVVRPWHVLVENVAKLLGRGMGTVLGDLAESGYDAEWDCIPAKAIGAPDLRDRVWIHAAPQHPDADSERLHPETVNEPRGAELRHQQVCQPGPMVPPMADAFAWVGSAASRGWGPEPGVCRVVDGVPRELVEPRLKALGNAVKPRIPELLGAAILSGRATPEDAAEDGSRVAQRSGGTTPLQTSDATQKERER